MKRGEYLHTSYLVIGVIAFCYVLLRAIKIGITYDEAWTINAFVPLSVMHIINFTPCDANNHLLNTLLIKLFFVFGKQSLFIARLPNVLGFVIYLFYGYKLTNKYLSPIIGICCFLLLLLNPFLLDFFSLARGYGLSLGFLLASIYFFLNYTNDGRISNVWKALGFGTLGVLCNFSLLNYWISLFLLINAISLFSNAIFNFKKTFLHSSINFIFLIIILYEPIRKLKMYGNLYYGGNTSFYTDTLSSLAKYTFYSTESNQLINYSLNTFLFILVLSVFISFIYKNIIFSLKNVIIYLTVLCILSIVIQHYLFGTLYLIDRTALFFYPLLILCLCFSLNELSKKIYPYIIVLVTIAFGINFYNCANLYKTATWYFDAHTKEMLSTFNEKGKQQNRKVKIDFSWPFQSSLGYYVKHHNYPYIEVIKNKQDREDLNLNSDYYIYLTKSLEKVGYNASEQKILSLSKDTVKQYKSEHIIIFGNIGK